MKKKKDEIMSCRSMSQVPTLREPVSQSQRASPGRRMKFTGWGWGEG